MTGIKTTCAYCGVGCGIIATSMDGEISHIEGDPNHPANYGKLCSKGLALGDTFDTQSRLEQPIVDGTVVSWADATQTVAQRLSETIKDHGPNSVAFYVSGQLLTEDYYVANKLMKGYIGSANIDTNSRLCMASTVAGHKRAFGADVVPGTYEDFEEADLVVLVGSNLAWCHPVLFQRLKAAQKNRGTKVVVIDPRRTESCDIADLHIPIMPDGDVLLFNGLLAHLHETGAAPTPYSNAHVNGYANSVETAQNETMLFQEAIKARGITDEVAKFFKLFTATEKAVTVFSQGVNQAHNGTDRVNAIINCHLATGRIGRTGMGPFSVTGQPNAMGGREVGGLANMLAAHMNFEPDERQLVQSFWASPAIAENEGLRAADMFDAVHDGRIKAIWIMATNPVVSMPNANKVQEALTKCPLVIVSDCVKDTDTQQYAHIQLPAAGWGEKDGTVTNSDRTISRQRAFRKPHKGAKADWRIIADIAAEMGWGNAFNYTSPSEIFREHAALTAYENDGKRALSLEAYTNQTEQDYQAMVPTKWPNKIDGQKAKRLFADGVFFTADKKARMVPISHFPIQETYSPKYPLKLNTGRYRDQWHTMTRTGLASKLSGHRPEPLLDICAKDAAQYGLTDKGFAKVFNILGQSIFRVRVVEDQQPGEIFIPIHWSQQHAGQASVGKLLSPNVDPISLQPAFKSGQAAVEPITMKWRGLLFSRTPIKGPTLNYWTQSQLNTCHFMRIADIDLARLDHLLTTLGQMTGDWIKFHDKKTGQHRIACLQNGKLELAFFAGPNTKGLSVNWIKGLFELPVLSSADRKNLLAGRHPGAMTDPGPIVCSCFQVGRYQIETAIQKGGLQSVTQIGEATCAGTNCGSCVPEIGTLLPQVSEKDASYAA